MKLLLPLLLCAILSGCASITRTEWEQGHPYDTKALEISLDNGDQRVVYRGLNPALDFSGNYSCPSGINVVTYRKDEVVQRYFQNDRAWK